MCPSKPPRILAVCRVHTPQPWESGVREGRPLWQESQVDLRELEGLSGPVTWRRLPKCP